MTEQYMLMFSLGPVQTFIAQARKSRDLWLGSFLLSALMEAAMKQFGKDSQTLDSATLVFPADPTLDGTIPDIPNKYVAIFDDAEQAKKAALSSKEAIFGQWREICNNVWSNVFFEKLSENGVASRIWGRQTNPETLFEIFWVVVEGEESEYNQWLNRTQLAFDACKQLRNFSHLYNPNKPDIPVQETGEKSTISGNREVLHGNDGSRPGTRNFWKALAQNFPESDLNQNGEERLDAIDSVKRFAFHAQIIHDKVREQIEPDDNELLLAYPSTSSIATASYVEQILRILDKQPDWPREIEHWYAVTDEHKSLRKMPPKALPYLYQLAREQQKLLRLLKRDGDCYFSETFRTTRLDKTYRIEPAAEIPKGKEKTLNPKHKDAVEKLEKDGTQALRDLYKATRELNITPPTPYYAMIQMDGDRIGILLSKVNSSKKHQEISKALSEFSRKDTPQIIERSYPGRLIYAGGDDVFALAPLVRDVVEQDPTIAKQTGTNEIISIFDLVDRLQATYCQRVGKAAPDLADEVSASVGIAIAHHYTSLSYVRRSSKEAEDQAKKQYGRASLVVSVLRRSGEQTTVGCHWHYKQLKEKYLDTPLLQPLELFKLFLQLFKDDILSPKCVYTLLEEAPALIGMADIQSNPLNDKEPDVRASEIKRVLQRQSDSKRLDEHPIDFAHLAYNIVALAEAMDQDDRGLKDPDKKKQRVMELHSDKARRGLIEVLGWLQVMVFLARKGQE